MNTFGMLPLNDGADMPRVGVVSFRRNSIKELREHLTNCVERGMRHFELSDLYGNADVVISHLMAQEVPREEFFITLKIWPKFRNMSSLVEHVKNTMESAELQYVDLLLLHAPIDVENRVDHWKALEAIKNDGLTRSIGLAYMTNDQLTDFIKNCTVIPAVLELEFSPFGQNEEVVEFCSDNGIAMLVDESSVKYMRHRDPELLSIAEDQDCSVDELFLRYPISKDLGVLVQPSYFSDRRREIKTIVSPLPQSLVSRLDALEEGLYSSWDPKEDLGDDEIK